MIVELYTIYDTIAQEAGPIFEAKNDGIARRAYKKIMSTHPEQVNVQEYSLIYLGTWDKDEIELKAEQTKVINPDYGDTTVSEGEE